MAQMWGANPDELDALALRVQGAAEALDTIRGQINAGLLSAHWEGPDANMSRELWSSKHSPMLENSVSGLREAATLLKSNAQAQREASGVGGIELRGTPVFRPKTFLNGHPGFIRYLGGPVTLLPIFVRLNGKGILNAWHTLDHTNSGSVSSGVSVGPAVSLSGHTFIDGTSASGSVGAYAQLYARAKANGSISIRGIVGQATVAVGAMAGVSAMGQIGNSFANASGNASASAGAQAYATASGSITASGAKADVKAGAFAGVQAQVSGTASVAGVSGTATGGVTAGIGAQVHASGSFTDTNIGFNIGGKASIGVGLTGGVAVHVDPEQVISEVEHFKLPW